MIRMICGQMAKMVCIKTNQFTKPNDCLVCLNAILLNIFLSDGEAFSSEMVAHLLNLKEENEKRSSVNV